MVNTIFDLHARELSFWSLLSENSIKIPDIQRDYAQGRDDGEIIRIRNGLIKAILKAVHDKNVLNLNFIYGRLFDDEFIPIDGQQRLTTLFLFHWYVARRSGNFNFICDNMKKFSYSTRDTSKRFCEYLCAPVSSVSDEYDFLQDEIKPQILDKPWFTGAFEHDPTVLSMLTVINSIHTELKENNDLVKAIYENFVSENCYVRFLLLPLEHYSDKATEDLYIKMNSRGKLLTDFEIFKGRLQESKAIREYAKQKLTDKTEDKIEGKIIELISTINTDCSELFYQFADECKDDIKVDDRYDPLIIFDKLLMKFFNEFCRYEYFVRLLEKGASLAKDDYRKQIAEFSEQSVSDLWDKIEEQHIIIDRAFTLLYVLNEYKDFIIEVKEERYFSRRLLLNVLDSTYKNNTFRYLSYCYLIKRHCIDEDFNYFKRVIYNIVENAGEKNFGKNADVSFRLVRYIIKYVNLNNDINKEIAALKPPFSVTIEIDQQLEEERAKATLILSSKEWETAIMGAEDYYRDGQIGFLLLLSKKDDEYNLAEFKSFFELSKMLFDGNKNTVCSLNDILFRKALLYMEDNTKDKMSYLLPSNTSKDSCFSFIKSNYKELLCGSGSDDNSLKRQIFIDLARRLKKSNPQNTNHVNLALKTIIDRNCNQVFSEGEEWKNIFLDTNNGLFESTWWKTSEKCIHKMKNGTILLLTKLKTSSQNWDIKTYIVAEKRKEVDNLERICVKDLKSREERFLTTSSGAHRIAYDYDENAYYISENNGEWKKTQEEDVLRLQ